MARFPEDNDVVARLADLDRRVKDMETAAGLSSSSIGAGGLVVRGEGAIRSDDFLTGVSGYRLGGDSLEVNDIVLRGGIIGNEALSNPVDVGGSTGEVTGFTVSTTPYEPTLTTIAVPAGYTQAIVICTANLSAYNAAGTTDYAYLRAGIAGLNGPAHYDVGTGGGGVAAVSASTQRNLTGLSGGSIALSARVETNGQNWGNISQLLSVSAIATFLR